MEAFAEYLAAHRAQHLQQLQDLLHIPSISTLPEHRADVRRCAEQVTRCAQEIGFEHAELLSTPLHPVVYADWLHAPGQPTVLIYGHYDVQPVDPLDLWSSPPFDPEIRDGKLYARGASDDKGPVFMLLKSFEALLQTEGRLPVNVKLCIEGEEEIGSPHLAALVEAQAERFRADVVVICDTPMLGPGRPAVCYGLRGLAALEVHVQGARSDLHSGVYGGMVQNAVHALVELLASMRSPDGRIAVDGFYDSVLPPTPAERQAIAALPFDAAEQAQQLGVPALVGEPGFSPLERAWVRPTLEVNGIWGGFQGKGTKTIIPAAAHAKITCRLVPDQDPRQIQQRLQQHIRQHAPAGVEVSVTLQDCGYPYVAPLHHPALQWAARVYTQAYGTPAALVRMGGSIPVVADLYRILQAPVVMLGFSLPDENFHAPDEHFSLDNFDKGMLTLCRYWLGLGPALRAEGSQPS
ncbi:MAG: dipeptidase [Alicyclobacillus sp.]|nr:dipeptidase [Alicyclobacillus sp.]